MGTWKFSVGTRGDKSVTDVCVYDNLGTVSDIHEFELSEENRVVDLSTGSEGTYTTIYNQGFEFKIDGNTWFVYYYFDSNGYRCDKTSVGYVHNAKGSDWGCVQGEKMETEPVVKEVRYGKFVNSENFKIEPWMLDQKTIQKTLESIPEVPFVHEPNFVKKLNSMDLPRTAGRNIENEKY